MALRGEKLHLLTLSSIGLLFSHMEGRKITFSEGILENKAS